VVGPHKNVTFVVDYCVSFWYYGSRKVTLVMDEWMLPEIDAELCDMCGACVAACPTGAVEMGAAGPVVVRPEDCMYCAACEGICPRGAIRCVFEIVWGEGG